MVDTPYLTLGIDPGWVNCGLAWKFLDNEPETVVYCPRSDSENGYYDAIKARVDEMWQKWPQASFDHPIVAYVERFVSYQGVQTQASENILMYIGAMSAVLNSYGIHVFLCRAIDWKSAVAKYLVRTQGFTNPDRNFGKKFSLAAAKALSGKVCETDHEADALCLSYMSEIETFNKERGHK